MDNDKKFEEAIKLDNTNLRCPYCDKQTSSTSGFRLHTKACKKAGINVKAARQLKAKMPVNYQLKPTKIVHIKDGLVLLSNGEIAPASKVVPHKKPPKPKGLASSNPKNAEEWVNFYCDKYNKESEKRQRAMIRILYTHTGYAKYRRWTDEDVQEALDKRFGVKKAKKKGAKK